MIFVSFDPFEQPCDLWIQATLWKKSLLPKVICWKQQALTLFTFLEKLPF